MKNKPKHKTSMAQFVIERLSNQKITVMIIVVALLVMSYLQFLIPQVTRFVIDDIIPNGTANELWVQLGVLFALTAGLALINYISNNAIATVSQRAITDLRNELYAHIMKQDYGFFETIKTGDIMEHVSADVTNVQELFSNNSFGLVGSIVTFIWVLTYLFIQDWLLALCISVTFPLLYFINRFFKRRLKVAYRAVRHASSQINQHLHVSLTSIGLIKNYANEQGEVQKFETLTADYDYHIGVAATLQSAYGPTLSMVDVIGTILVLAYGAPKVMNGTMTLGVVVSYMSYLVLLQRPMRSFSSIVNRVQQARVSFDRIQRLFEVQPKIVNNYMALPMVRRNDIQFNNVVFHYCDGEPVLNGLNMTIPHGKMTALVGASGNGKTTLTKLLMRHYDVVSGEILINDEDIRNYEIGSLRQNIAIVTQDVDIMDGSIYENITYGAYSASMRNVVSAARSANILSFIKSLPDGFDTQVGERGLKLSGGQKQRIALARAFLKQAPILILDEATASLDNESERYIQASLDELLVNKTSLVIAHRLSTIRNADKILVLEGGIIIEEGTHDELINKSARYAQIYESQFRDKE